MTENAHMTLETMYDAILER